VLNVHTLAMLESSWVCPYNMTQRVTDMPNEILDSDNVWDSDLLWTYNGRKLATTAVRAGTMRGCMPGNRCCVFITYTHALCLAHAASRENHKLSPAKL